MKQPTRRTWLGAAVTAVVLLASSQAFALGTPAGTPITNQATVDYEDANGNPLQALSNVVTTTVSQVGAVDVSPNNATSANPGDTVPYLHTVTNNGNGSDTIDLTASSSQGWTVTLYVDDGDGVFEPGTDDLPPTDSDTDATPDTGALLADGTLDIWAAVDVPAGTVNGTVDTTTVTGTSSFDTNVSGSATDTTTITAPTLSVVKSVSPAGNQPPGTTLTYSIVVTNNGAATANLVVLTDPIPANTTYVGNSITQDAATRTDADGDDNADHNVTNPNTVTVDIGSLASSASTTITFQVTID
jgi:uncharacterized repeat protein (TIGR01451 family)